MPTIHINNNLNLKISSLFDELELNQNLFIVNNRVTLVRATSFPEAMGKAVTMFVTNEFKGNALWIESERFVLMKIERIPKI